MTASPNNTVITAPGQIITDASGNRWQLSSGKIVINGIVDNTSNGVRILAYENGKIWQMNTDRMWWGKIKPSDAWSPQYGTTVSPLVSGFSPNMVIGVNHGGENFVITDRNFDRWTITADGRVAVNGVADVSTGRVIALAYENGRVWQANADGLWWSKSKSTDAWGPTYGTKTSPIPIIEDLAPGFKSFTSGFVSNVSDSYVPTGSDYLTVDDGGKPVTFNYFGYNTADQLIRNAEEGLIINVNGTLTLGGTLNTQGGIANATTTLNLEAGSTFRNLGLVSTTAGSPGGIRSNLTVRGAGNFENHGTMRINGGAFDLNTAGTVLNTGQMTFTSSFGTAHNLVTSGNIVNTGTIHSYNVSTIGWGTPGGAAATLTNTGSIGTEARTTMKLTGSSTISGGAHSYNATLINNGVISVNGGGARLEIAAPLKQSGSSHIDIGSGSSAILDSSSDGGTINITDGALYLAGDNMSYMSKDVAPVGASGFHSTVVFKGTSGSIGFNTTDTLTEILKPSAGGTYDLIVTGSRAGAAAIPIATVHLGGGSYHDSQFNISGSAVIYTKAA